MRAIVQRTARARVTVSGEEIASIGKGILVLVGIARTDTPKDIDYIVKKSLEARIFEDEAGVMNLSVLDLGLDVLVVSQFTLLGDLRKGRRPSYSAAAPPGEARDVWDEVVRAYRGRCTKVQTGRFQEHMEVELTNDGPVTILLESKKEF